MWRALVRVGGWAPFAHYILPILTTWMDLPNTTTKAPWKAKHTTTELAGASAYEAGAGHVLPWCLPPEQPLLHSLAPRAHQPIPRLFVHLFPSACLCVRVRDRRAEEPEPERPTLCCDTHGFAAAHHHARPRALPPAHHPGPYSKPHAPRKRPRSPQLFSLDQGTVCIFFPGSRLKRQQLFDEARCHGNTSGPEAGRPPHPGERDGVPAMVRSEVTRRGGPGARVREPRGLQQRRGGDHGASAG